jgi:superfamily I DNA/RNA helicase/mRNA-degrading endonuclease RelE of RelBE toxin-antitoxin system
MSLNGKITIAISSDFLSAFSEIPRKEQKRVREFVEAFKQDPEAPRFNYEKIKGAVDKNIRSVRIDHEYRGIVLKPEQGNVYLLLWVDSHDRAYSWAVTKSFNINPVTGSIQVVDLSTEDVLPKDDEKLSSFLFGSYTDKDLIQISVPEVLIPLVRSVTDDIALDKIEPHLPQEAYESLFMLAAGEEIEDIKHDIKKNKLDADLRIDDFEKALNNLDTKRRFHVVEEELELAEILNWPLEKWRVFLHPSQYKIVRKVYNGPARVLGGAGTGKTVVAMHRAKFLAEQVWTNTNNRILFTTFTRNLASDIQENLKKICSDSVLRRIEVINLDAWVAHLLKKNGYKSRIMYENELRPIWENVLNEIPEGINLDRSFFHHEWEKVIQHNGISTLDEYLHVPRIGLGKRLDRATRRRIWPIFEEYRSQLTHHGYKESIDAIRDARSLLINAGDILPYNSIIVDESQDLSKEAFKLIRQMIPLSRTNIYCDLFIVGDSHQRIYSHKIVLSHCGINIIGRGNKLKINYRTTEETRRWSVNLLKGLSFDDLDGGNDNQKGYKSLLHGSEPSLNFFSGFSDEIKYIMSFIKQMVDMGEPMRSICLVVRTNEMLKQYEGALKSNDIPTFTIKRNYSESTSPPGVRLATMHRVKGLEFNYVIIAAVNDGLVPFINTRRHTQSKIELQEVETRERCLLYVAATRAKKELLVTSFGKASKLIEAHDPKDVRSSL